MLLRLTATYGVQRCAACEQERRLPLAALQATADNILMAPPCPCGAVEYFVRTDAASPHAALVRQLFERHAAQAG